MKVIEQILLELDMQNLAKTIHDIHGQLDYYSKHKVEVEAISLLPIRDLLDPKYTDDVLRNNGYILTIAQFKEDAAKFLELAANDPILYNSRLKRLHRGFQVLQKNYVKGDIRNKVVIAEIKKQFTDSLVASYCQGASDGEKMPGELSNRIAQTLQRVIEDINKEWLKNTLFADAKTELTDKLISHLYEDSQKDRLDPAISKQLQIEKNKINSVDALLSHFREKKLPEQVQNKLQSTIIGEITKEVEAEHITTTSELGSTIKTTSGTLLGQNLQFRAYQLLIANWQNKQISSGAANQLEAIIRGVIDKAKPELESTLKEQFDKLAARIFLEKLQQGEWPDSIMNVMQAYTSAITKQLFMHASDSNNLQKCRELINKNAMLYLHGEWVGGKLTAKENNFIKEIVFATLNEIDDKIQERVWPNNNKANGDQIMQKIEAKFEAKFAQQNKLIEQLITQLQANNLGVTTGNASNALLVDKGIPSSSVSFFGK